MKKLFAILFIGLLAVSVTACGQKSEKKASETAAETTAEAPAATEAQEVIAGGFTDAASPVLTDEVKAMFDKATEGLTGVGYTPVAYVASQVVAGTNHLILCKAEPVTAEEQAFYALVTVYEDLEGNAEIISVYNSEAPAPAADDGEPLDGAAAEPSSPEVTADAKEALTKATEGRAAASYQPLALLTTQVVNGINYNMLCKITPVTPGAASSEYAIVTVYANSDGSAEITYTYNFKSAE